MTGTNDIALREKGVPSRKPVRRGKKKTSQFKTERLNEPWENRFGFSVSDLLLEGKYQEIELTDMFAALTKDFQKERNE